MGMNSDGDVRIYYKVKHVALLAHCPIPPAADIPTYRTAVVALEAAFSCLPWAMYRRHKYHGFAHLCSWSCEDSQRQGLCPHSALNEPITGSIDFKDTLVHYVRMRPWSIF